MSNEHAKRNQVENLYDWSNRVETALWTIVEVLVLTVVVATAGELLHLMSKLR
jgi:hypothetical protein